MRITNEMSNRMLVNYLLDSRDAAFDLQEQISSGKRVQHPSDDPGAFSLISRLHKSESCLTQYTKNIDRLDQDLKTLDAKTQTITDNLHRVSELIITASNTTTPPEDREKIGEEVNQLLEDLVATGNSNPEGRYIYAGLRENTPPYTVTRDANGYITAVTYDGSQQTRQVEISEGVYLPATIVGTNQAAGDNGVFQTTEVDLFADLIQLRDRLFNGENPVNAESFAADDITDILTVGHVYNTGAMVKLETDGTLPAGLSSTATYYAIRVSATEIRLATSLANARAGLFIDLTDVGAGAHGITQQSLEENTRDLDHILNILGTIGSREERLNANRGMIASHMQIITNQLANEESTDIAKASTELANQKTAYEASLRVTIAMLDTSLIKLL